MSAWSDAFTEVKDEVEPDVDPTLTFGNFSTAEPTKELDRIILRTARGVVWAASTALAYGQVVYPLTRMGRRYRVTVGGISGATEPAWPDSDYSTVTDGTAVLTEDGPDSSSIYDVRAAKRAAWEKKAAKASEYLDDEDPIYRRCVERSSKFQSIGVA
jgi:hypothetical protein